MVAPQKYTFFRELSPLEKYSIAVVCVALVIAGVTIISVYAGGFLTTEGFYVWLGGLSLFALLSLCGTIASILTLGVGGILISIGMIGHIIDQGGSPSGVQVAGLVIQIFLMCLLSFLSGKLRKSNPAKFASEPE